MKNALARSSKTLLALAVGAVLAGTSTWSLAQGPAATEAATSRPAQDVTVAESMQVPTGRSTLIRTPWPVARVSVTDPKIADVQVLTPQQVLVLGKAMGTTDVIMWGKEEQAWKATVEVIVDRTALKADLTKLFPRAKLDFRQTGGAIVLTGQLSRAEEAEQLHRYMESAGVKYVDLTALPGVAQVQLKVTVAEASRQAIRALGFNVVHAGKSAFGGINIGPENSGPFNPVNVGMNGTAGNTGFPVLAAVSPATTLFAGIPSSDLEIFVQALAENQYLRVLAEPTLTALSGQEASFLAGGEFPIPVPQTGSALGGQTTITVEYKEFGVRLRFRPTVQGDGLIRLHVAPEVSDINNGPGSVQVQGFNIPALLTRRAETTLDVGSGQTFAMAGLISQNVQARNSRVPGLGDIPVLGALFRSARYQAGDTELLVLVTASLVEPQSPGGPVPVPGVGHVTPNDWEFYALGAIEGVGRHSRLGTDMGPASSDLKRLHGPGAWATYDPPAPTPKTAAETH